MADEHLTRTPTSGGNRRVFTYSGWFKRNKLTVTQALIGSFLDSNNRIYPHYTNDDTIRIFGRVGGSTVINVDADEKFRDVGNWHHIIIAVDTTQDDGTDRTKIYLNGVQQQLSVTTQVSKNTELYINVSGTPMLVGKLDASGSSDDLQAQLTDIFYIDGQALTPDVFGFYKDGDGYISAGSTQATDFRPGQWVPKTPRVIKTEINRRGGFGVNGFYLPMNDSSNFGADFHTTPNSIIKLGEDLQQPKVSIASTAQAGLAFTDVLRADPYAANLVLALPFVSGGLGTDGTSSGINTGFGDYSALIKGSGSAKVVTLSGDVTITNVSSAKTTAVFYGSGAEFDGTGDFLTVEDTGSDFDFGSGDFTIEFWRNKSTFATESYVARLDSGGGSSTSDFWFGNASGADAFYWYEGATGHNITSPSGISTVGQWDHLAAERYGNTIALYVNGVAVGLNTAVTYSFNNGTADFRVGGDNAASGDTNYPFEGSIQDLRVYKGVAKYKGGFDVPRPYTPVGIATWRAVPDTTANNFATMNSLNSSSNVTLSEGNLNTVTSSAIEASVATVGVSTGKWYWEVYNHGAPTAGFLGITGVGHSNNGTNFYDANQLLFDGSDGSVYYSSYDTRSTTSWGDGDTVKIKLDLDNQTLEYGVNGGSYVGLATITDFDSHVAGETWLPTSKCGSSGGSGAFANVYNFGQNTTYGGRVSIGTFTDSNGKGLFKYEPPTDFLALCEDNLPTPAIKNPGEYFKTVLYTGDGTDGKNIVGVGFTPDLVWVKARNQAYNHGIFDSVRGSRRTLYANLTNAEAINGPFSFNADGFSLSSNWNNSNTNFVAWCWRAGAGTTSTNTDGSIDSVVSVNQDAGFSIVSYTGTGSNATVGHGLDAEPKMIIAKRRSGATDNWPVYHASEGPGRYAYLDLNNAFGTDSSVWQNVTPTSSVFSIGGSATVNASGAPYIAYCWAEIPGFSKFGRYIGNGDANGVFNYTGFKPAFLIVKRVLNSDAWLVMDSARSSTNPVTNTLATTGTGQENIDTGGVPTDFLSNGFKCRGTGGDFNGSGETYIYMAFAESPFTTANAK